MAGQLITIQNNVNTNSFTLQRNNLYKGYFPSRFGGRLSSVIDVNMKEGNRKEKELKLGLGVLTSHLLIEGPFVKDKSSYLFAGRYSYFGIVNLLKKNRNKNYFNYWLYDLNGKINIPVKIGRLFISTYWGNDNGINQWEEKNFSGNTTHSINELENIVTWGNKTTTLRYILPISSKIFTSFQIGWANYKYDYNFFSKKTNFKEGRNETNDYSESSSSNFNDFIINYKFNFYPNPNHSIRLGGEINSKFNEIKSSTLEKMQKTYDAKALETNVFIEDEIKLTNFFSINAGIRASGFFNSGKNFYFLDPRLELMYDVDKLRLSTSISHVHQNIHLISQDGFGLPNDIWVLASEQYPVQSSWQQSLNLGYNFSNSHSFDIGLYRSLMKNLITYSVPFEYGDDAHFVDWAENVKKDGAGRARGFELLYSFSSHFVDVVSSYTIGFSERKFKEINNNEWYPYDFDRRHNFSTNFQYKLSAKWNFSSSFIYYTGRAITLPVSRILLPGGQSYGNSFLSKNNANFPYYSRVDLGVTYTKINRRNDKMQFNFSIYNLLNRKNPNYFYFKSRANLDADGNFINQDYFINQVSLFPLIPALSIEYEFK